MMFILTILKIIYENLNIIGSIIASFVILLMKKNSLQIQKVLLQKFGAVHYFFIRNERESKPQYLIIICRKHKIHCFR